MKSLESVLPSTKVLGRFERPAIESVARYFSRQGYLVAQHVRLNVAWSSILSDVDVLATDGTDIIAVEVKSSRDNASRATRQLRALRSYVDYLYLAIEGNHVVKPERNVGLLLIQGDEVVCTRTAMRQVKLPDVASLVRLQRICLSRISSNGRKYPTKMDLAREAHGSLKGNLRRCLSEVVTCSRQCDTACPIWKYHAFD